MNGDLILIIPVLLIIVAIMFLVRHMRGGTDDSIAALIGIVPIVIIIGVAIGIIVSMASIADPWEWDADSKTLTIDGNIHDTGLSYPWTGYANQVETLVIEPGVEFVQGPAFARMTNLEYVDIAAGVTLDDGAFSQTFKDPFNADIAMSDVAGYEYVGAEDGTLYQCVEGMFTFDGEERITGLSSDYSDAVNLVLPSTHNGSAIQGVRYEAFRSNSAITSLLVMPGSSWTSIGSSALRDCTSLSTVVLPDTLQAINTSCFYGCTSLEYIDLPDALQSIGNSAFRGTGLTSVVFPDAVQSIDQAAFYGCSSLASVIFPASITSIGIESFKDCTGITSIAFAEGFAPTLSSSWCPWSFYDSDGTTAISKTDASALAGNTFQGTATALVKVAPGQLTLTPQQIQQVHLHDAELERMKLEAISIGPLPFELQDV